MANTKVTGDLIASSTIATGNIADNAVTSDKISGITTAHITEGSNLYYTDARADARITAASTSDLSEGTNLYYTDARADARAALIVDSAPATLDTLNELAAALGDDPNFATTTATSIGLKAPLASPSFTGNATFAGDITLDDDLNFSTNGFADISNTGTGAMRFKPSSQTLALTLTGANATFAGDVYATGTSNSNVVISRDNMYVDAGQIYIGADGSTTDDTFRQRVTSGSYFIESRKSGTWTNRLQINSAGTLIASQGATFAGLVQIGASSITNFSLGSSGSDFELSAKKDGTDAINMVFKTQASGGGLAERMRITSEGDIQFTGNSHTPYIQLVNSGRTAGNPGFTFNNDTNTGMFQPAGAADTIAFSTGGVERMRIDSSGNVRIGTGGLANTHSKLDVIGGPYAFLALQATDTGGRRWELFSYATTESFHIYDRTNDQYRFTIDETGKVGIGTNSPDNKLTIATGTGGGSAPDSRTQLYIDKNGEAYISINSPAESFNGIRLSVAGTPKGFMELYDNTAQGKKLNIGTADARDVVIATNNTERMRIDSSGTTSIVKTSVGNSTTPLVVRNAGSINVGTESKIFLSTVTSDNRGAYISSIITDTSNGNALILATNTAGAEPTERMRITSSGNVGIGTIAPGGGLEIKTLSGGSGVNTLRLNTSFGGGNTVDINPFITGLNNGGMEIKLAGSQKLVILPNGNVGVGTASPGDAKLYVNGGTTLGGAVNTSEGAIRMFGDRKLPQASNFVRRNYRLTAGAGNALYSIARQWHDVANWGTGNINVIMWGIYYGKNNFSKADFSCRYGYSGNAADVETNFNPGSLTAPSWTAPTQVSGNVYYRDLQIQIPAYTQVSFEIISPGLTQTYSISNTSHNHVYLYPH